LDSVRDEILGRRDPRGSVPSVGASDGDPAVRMHYDEGYYAAFIRDPDGNRIEAVRFLRSRV
jgi:catechol 2,3-dioxygenase-like lactoylglutathione lyase family enzyme